MKQIKEVKFNPLVDFKLPDLLDVLESDDHIYFAEPHWWAIMEFIFGRELSHVTGIGKVDMDINE